MGKKRKIPSYKELIAKEQAKIDKEIRETEYPWLNLVRLTREPCRSYECESTSHLTNSDPTLDLFICFIVGGIALYLWSQARSYVPYLLLAIGYCAIMLLMLYAFVHLRRYENWTAHTHDREQRRSELRNLQAPSITLPKALTEALSASREQLFGEKSHFVQWKNALKARSAQAGPSTKEDAQPATANEAESFRQLSGKIRVQVIEENMNFKRAIEGLSAFEANAHERIAKLERDIQAIGVVVEAYTHTKNLPLAEQSAKEPLTRLNTAIEDSVTAFHLTLWELEDDTARACAEAASALTANFALEAEETANAIRGEGSKVSFRAKRSA